MNVELTTNWNMTVGPEDEVYILGDVCFTSKQKAYDIISRLNGKKYLIRGNHDKPIKGEVLELFEWVKHYEKIWIQDPDMKGGKVAIILCHYPILSWDMKFHNSIHIHGHSHNPVAINPEEPRRVDVGVDAWGYRPVSYEEIKKAIFKAEKEKEKMSKDSMYDLTIKLRNLQCNNPQAHREYVEELKVKGLI